MSYKPIRIWELVDMNNVEWTHRMRVPGGWIVKVTYTRTNGTNLGKKIAAVAVSLVFIQDADHQWKV